MGLNLQVTQQTRFWALHYDILESLEKGKIPKTDHPERGQAIQFFTNYLKQTNNDKPNS